MRCEQCENIPECEIRTPIDYLNSIQAFGNMMRAGLLEVTYQTCPLENIFDDEGRFYAEKLFHQFRCTKCGTIYGMFVNARGGGEIKINDKAFDPADYPDKSDAENNEA